MSKHRTPTKIITLEQRILRLSLNGIGEGNLSLGLSIEIWKRREDRANTISPIWQLGCLTMVNRDRIDSLARATLAGGYFSRVPSATFEFSY